MKISKKDLRRIILEGVVASLEEKKKKKSRKRSEDPPKSIDNNPSDPTTATTDESREKALEFLSKAIEEHRAGNENARQENLNLMKMIIAPPPNGLPDKYKSVAEHIKKKAKVEMGINIDFDQKVSTTPQAQAQGGARKSKSNPKTAYIQKVIKAPSSKGGIQKGDGQWGENTSDAWRAWVKSSDTLKKFTALLKKEKGPKQDSPANNESLDLYEIFTKIIGEQEVKNSVQADKDVMEALPSDLQKLIQVGDAAKIAAYFKLSPTLTGVEQLVKKLEKLKPDSDKKSKKTGAAASEWSVEEIKTIESLMGRLPQGLTFVEAEIKGPATIKLKPEGKDEVSVSTKNTNGAMLFDIAVKSNAHRVALAALLQAGSVETMVQLYDRLGRATNTTRLKDLVDTLPNSPSKKIMMKIINSPKNLGSEIYKFALDEPGFVSSSAFAERILASAGDEEEVTSEKVAESLSHGALIRKRYWGRY